MSQLNPTPSTVEQKALDALIERLINEVSTARSNSNDFYAKITRLSNFILDCDSEKSEASPPSDEGLLSTLNELINNLRFINRRNVEILQQIDKLM